MMYAPGDFSFMVDDMWDEIRCMERIAKIGWDQYVKESIILQN